MKAVYSTATKPAEAAGEIRDRLGNADLSGVLFFASSAYDPAELAGYLQEGFGDTPVFGCTTAGEIADERMLKGAVAAMGLSRDVVGDIDVRVVADVHDLAALEAALDGFAARFGEPVNRMDPERYVGIVLVDGLSGGEEKLMERLGDRADVIFVGGSAGDDLKFRQTHVFAGGKAHSGAAALALMRPVAPFEIVKTQSFRSTGKALVASRVDEAGREVLEFNGGPAAAAYAAAAGVPVEAASGRFMHNPVGLMVGSEPYVRSPQRIDGDKMRFYCNVREGMKLELLEGADIVADTQKAVDDVRNALGAIAGIINFHCILRTLELEDKKQTQAYGRIFSGLPTIGFSTYGEQYLGHINQTSTMLVFGRKNQAGKKPSP